MKTLAYFISGHGFGHGVRSCEVINAVSKNHTVLIFSNLPISFFNRELTCPFQHFPVSLDCGCVQRDAARVDIAATLALYEHINRSRMELTQKTVEILIRFNVDIVLADIPPLAFEIAGKAGIPSYGISNFSWVDIYEPYLEQYPQFGYMVSRMKDDYRKASGYFSIYPGMEGKGFLEKRETGMISRRGAELRKDFALQFGLEAEKKWGLIYIGGFGMEDVNWKRLEQLTGWEFLGLQPVPDAPCNFHALINQTFRYADLTASCDLIIGKLGYGLVSESLRHAKPVIFFPRLDFSEYSVLKEAVAFYGLGIEISLDKFKQLDLSGALQIGGNCRAEPCKSDGISQIIDELGLG